MSIRTESPTQTATAPRSRLHRIIGSVVEAALTPHPVDRYLELVDPMLTWRDLRAQIVGIERPTARAVRLTLRPTRQWRGHTAGQYVQVKVVIDGVRHSRCFSPANAGAGPDGLIELTVTAHQDGVVSRYLYDQAGVGDVVGLAPAAGEFTLPASAPRSAVFISGGSGITPVLSMLRTLTLTGYSGPITFVHYVPTPDDLAYGPELAALATLYDNVDLRIQHTRAVDDAPGEHFTDAHLSDVTDLAEADVFVCGPPALMDAVADFHRRAGIRRPLHSEAFQPPAPAPVDPDEPVTGDLTFASTGRRTPNDGRPILEQAEAAGLSPESGCRMGICFSCTATKTSGCTRNVLTGDVDTDVDKQIQLCINAPVGDVTIDI